MGRESHGKAVRGYAPLGTLDARSLGSQSRRAAFPNLGGICEILRGFV
jgi:hypothetical protein